MKPALLLSLFGTLSLVFCVLLIVFLIGVFKKQPSVLMGLLTIGCLGSIFYLISQLNIKSFDINIVLAIFINWVLLCISSVVTIVAFQSNSSSDLNENKSKNKATKILSGVCTTIFGSIYIIILLVQIALI